MPLSNSETRLGRAYLETYYPSRFDEMAFQKALGAIADHFGSGQSTLDVAAFSARYGLGHEVIENASILFHLCSVAESIGRLGASAPTVLDVGGGPTMYQHIPLSLIAEKIIHAEPLEENRQEILDYLSGVETAYDWNAYIRATQIFIASRSTKFPILSRRLSELIDLASEKGTLVPEEAWRVLMTDVISGRVVPCDAFRSDLELSDGSALRSALLAADMTDGATLVESNFLLESATDSIAEWHAGLDALLGKAVSGGFFSMMAIRNACWYRSGEERVPAVPVDESFLKQEIERRGFSVVQVRILTGSDSESFGYDGMVFLLANKNMA